MKVKRGRGDNACEYVLKESTLNQLRFILKSARETLANKSSEDIKQDLLEGKKIEFKFDEYLANEGIEGSIRYQEYKLLDLLYEKEFGKLLVYSEKIHKIEKEEYESEERDI